MPYIILATTVAMVIGALIFKKILGPGEPTWTMIAALVLAGPLFGAITFVVLKGLFFGEVTEGSVIAIPVLILLEATLLFVISQRKFRARMAG